MNKTASLKIDDKTQVDIELFATEIEKSKGDMGASDLIESATIALGDIARKIKQVSTTFVDEVSQTQVDAVEISFGIKLTSKSNFLVAAGEADANFAVKLVWKREKSEDAA
jgi:hypothetical protein